VLFINKRIFLCTLFRLIFIALQNVGVISAAPCIYIYIYIQENKPYSPDKSYYIYIDIHVCVCVLFPQSRHFLACRRRGISAVIEQTSDALPGHERV